MADSKISALSDGTPMQAADLLVVARAGVDNKITANQKLIQSFVGHNAVGANIEANSSTTWKFLFKTFTLSTPGLLNSIDLYCKGNASNVNALYAALFDDNSGAIGNAISVGNFPGEDSTALHPLFNQVFSSTPRWVAVPMGVWLPAATYWMCVAWGGSSTASSMSVYYDSGGSDPTITSNATWLNQDGGGGSSNSSRNYSLRGSIIT